MRIYRELLCNGRFYGISTIMAIGYAYEMAPAMRANIDYIFMFKEKNLDNLKRLYQYFFYLGFETFKEFKEASVLEDYKALVLERATKKVTWYKEEI